VDLVARNVDSKKENARERGKERTLVSIAYRLTQLTCVCRPQGLGKFTVTTEVWENAVKKKCFLLHTYYIISVLLVRIPKWERTYS
jgi:hypothetical protein